MVQYELINDLVLQKEQNDSAFPNTEIEALRTHKVRKSEETKGKEKKTKS